MNDNYKNLSNFDNLTRYCIAKSFTGNKCYKLRLEDRVIKLKYTYNEDNDYSILKNEKISSIFNTSKNIITQEKRELSIRENDIELNIGELDDSNIIMLLKTIKLICDKSEKIDSCLEYVQWLFQRKKT